MSFPHFSLALVEQTEKDDCKVAHLTRQNHAVTSLVVYGALTAQHEDFFNVTTTAIRRSQRPLPLHIMSTASREPQVKQTPGRRGGMNRSTLCLAILQVSHGFRNFPPLLLSKPLHADLRRGNAPFSGQERLKKVTTSRAILPCNSRQKSVRCLPHVPPNLKSTSALQMALVPLSVDDLDSLLHVSGAPTGEQAASYWGRTQRERYGRIFESSVVTIIGVIFSYFLSFVLGGFVATILGSIFLFWGSCQLIL